MDYYGLLFLYYLKGLSGKSVLKLFFNIEAGGTEQLLPENTSTPATTPILADIQYPDGLRTDQYFTYRETPTTVSNKARIKTIKGQTLKWNQLVYNGNFTSTDGWAGQSGNPTLSVADNSITVTMTSGSPSVFNPAIAPSSQYPLIANHKYLFSFDFKATKAGVCLYLRTNAFGGGLNFFPILQSANTWTSYKNIVTATNTEDIDGYFGLSYGSDSGITIGDSFSLRNLMIIDLTALGIADKTNSEILQWFADYFPLSYYSYNSGSLIPFMGNGIKTTPNIANVEYEQGAINSSVAGNTYESNKANNTTRIRVKNLIYNEDEKTYSLYFNSILFDVIIQPYDSNGLSVHSTLPYDSWKTTSPIVFTATGSVAIAFRYKTSATITADAISQIKPIMYKQEDESVLNLPISTYFPTGMKSAGNVYDELTPIKAITRIGVKTFNGSENWAYDSNNALFQCAVSGAIVIDAVTQYNVYTKNNRFDDKSWATRSDGSLGMYYGASYIFIKSTQFADVNALKTWLQSNPLTVYYGLATPIETPITTEDANEALSLLMGKSVSSNNANQLINIITKGE